MLEKDKGPAQPHAFLIAIDIQDGVDMREVELKLADAVLHLEGCGRTEVECLGPIDCYDEKEPSGINT